MTTILDANGSLHLVREPLPRVVSTSLMRGARVQSPQVEDAEHVSSNHDSLYSTKVSVGKRRIKYCLDLE